MAMNQIRNSVLLILIWVQTVCKCFQQTPKVTASKEWMRLHSAGSKIIPEFLWISWSLWAIQNSLSIVYVWYIRAVTILLLSMLLSWDCCCKYYLSTDQNWIWKKWHLLQIFAVWFGSTLFDPTASKTFKQMTKSDDICCGWCIKSKLLSAVSCVE